MTTPTDRVEIKQEWRYSFWFAGMISAIQALGTLTVARFGGLLFGEGVFTTTFDESEIRLAIGSAVLCFPITLICYRYRPNGSGRP